MFQLKKIANSLKLPDPDLIILILMVGSSGTQHDNEIAINKWRYHRMIK